MAMIEFHKKYLDMDFYALNEVWNNQISKLEDVYNNLYFYKGSLNTSILN